MHTKKADELFVHHNSDWSGEAIITYRGQEMRVPAEALQSVCKQAVADQVERVVESAIDDWVRGG